MVLDFSSYQTLFLVVEYCGVSSRTFPLMMMMVSYSAASLIMPLIASAIPHWIYLAVASTFLPLPVLAAFRSISL
jgi:hypothetical protein